MTVDVDRFTCEWGEIETDGEGFVADVVAMGFEGMAYFGGGLDFDIDSVGDSEIELSAARG